MKKIKYLFFLCLINLFFSVANAESLKIELVGESNNILNFAVIVDELEKSETINVYEGVVTYPSSDVTLSLIKEDSWEVYYKEEDGKVRFLAYNLNGYAGKDTSILKFNTTLKDENVKDVKIALNNITTSDGLENIDIGQATYNYKKVVVETPVAPETEIPKKEETIEKPKEEVKEETTGKEDNENIVIPEDDLINGIDEEIPDELKENKESGRNNFGFVISLVLVLLLISFIIIVFILAMKDNKKDKEEPKKEIKKEEKKTPKRRGIKKKISKGVDK